MRKNIEWLKMTITNLDLNEGLSPKESGNELLGAFRNTVLDFIDQLEEPEITEEQAWNKIELENSYQLAPAHTEVYKEAIQNGVKPECFNKPEKPVIPQFVADWIESYRKKTLVELINDAVYSSDEDSKCFRRWFHDEMGFESNYSEFLSRAWLDGYEVEKEKRYYISDEMDNATLMTFDLSDETGKEIIEFVVGYSENETIHFDSKEKAELIARFVGDSVKVEELEG